MCDLWMVGGVRGGAVGGRVLAGAWVTFGLWAGGGRWDGVRGGAVRGRVLVLALALVLVMVLCW